MLRAGRGFCVHDHYDNTQASGTHRQTIRAFDALSKTRHIRPVLCHVPETLSHFRGRLDGLFLMGVVLSSGNCHIP